ncbi:preprotein translocase subunit SecD [Bordetella avium]|uniref:SecDF P1 head subdomain-containing protein n=1 Tax=Bordetella avium TaxID=521 RepID=UPI00307EC38E
MTLTMRKLAPAALIAVLALAGCAAPKSGDKPAASNAGQPPQAQAQAQTPAPAPATSPTVEFYIATTTADPSLVAVPVADGTLYMQRTPVLTRADQSEAQARDDRSGQNYVGLRFNEAGARKLSDISTQNQGKILVLVIDRELVAAPRLTEPLTRGVLAFGVPSAQAAVAIAAKIRGDAAAAPKP